MLTALLVAAFGLAPAATALAKSKSKGGGADCSDPDDTPDFPWQRFKVGDTCVETSNTLTFVYQKLMKSSGAPPLPARAGTASSDNPLVTTFTFEPTIATSTPTGVGDLETSLDVQVQRNSDDSSAKASLQEATVALAGATVGYTDSVMNFWSGDDFQFSATAPSRTVGVVRYEHEVFENAKFGLSLETGVPTSKTSSDDFAPMYPDDPVLGARWLYETDPLTVQLAAIAHQLKFDHSDRTLPIARTSGSVYGWAVTAGATVALPVFSDDDNVSGQVTYAVNASPYLGTQADLSTLWSVVPGKVDTRGWSAVVSYHRAWSDQWSTNLFISELMLDVQTTPANPSVATTRFAANLVWQPKDFLKFGGELGYLNVRIDPNGVIGLLSGQSGRQLTGYLFAELDF